MRRKCFPFPLRFLPSLYLLKMLCLKPPCRARGELRRSSVALRNSASAAAGGQTKRGIAIRGFLSQQNRGACERGSRQRPDLGAHIRDVRVGQLVGHAHVSRDTVLELPYDIRKITAK